MADYGAIYTDKTITKLDKEIQAVYKEAEKDIQKKMDDFNAKYKIKEQKYQQKVDSGQMTQEEFDRWKKGQVFQGQQWQAKKDQILDTMHHSNEIATKIINGQSQNIFMVNANYMSYDIEHGAGVNFGFGLYDQNTVANLIADDPKLLPEWKINEKKDYIWSQKKLNNAITQGIIQGESLDKISKRISDKLASTNENKMKTFARTAMTGAQNSGRQMQLENAKKLDIEVQKEWMATLDARTRDSHKDLDGEKVDVGKEFSNGLMFPGDPNGAPAQTYNCFIPETSVASDSEIIRSYKHWYSGKVVSIKSAGGVNFTCTPNHPILTDRGWIAAKFLNEGDHLIVTSGINNEISRRNPNINHAFPAINTIHQLFDKIGGERTSVLGVNFHGDVATSDVEVITQERFLGTNFDTGTGKSVNKFLLKYTDTSFMRKSSFMEHFRSVVRTTFSNISGMCKFFSIFRRCLSHTNIHRFGAVSDVNLSISEYSINDLPTNPDFFGESLIGLTGKIFLDDIINVDVSDFTGHVYNLQTKNNYYFVNNNTNNTKSYNNIFAIAHNCRCTMVSDVKKYPATYDRYDAVAGRRISNISYRDWENEKRKQMDAAEAKNNPFADKSMSKLYYEMRDKDSKLANQFYKELGSMGKPSEIWNQYVMGTYPGDTSKLTQILNDYAQQIGINMPKAVTEPDYKNIFGNKSMSKLYYEMRDKDSKLANGFYKDLGKMGKPSEVWSQYLNGTLDKDKAKQIENYLSKYNTMLNPTTAVMPKPEVKIPPVVKKPAASKAKATAPKPKTTASASKFDEKWFNKNIKDNGFSSGTKFDEDIKKEMIKQLEKTPDAYKQTFIGTLKKIKNVNYDEGRSYYRDGSRIININLEKKMKECKHYENPLHVYFHEMGHAIDYNARPGGFRFTSGTEFKEAFKKDIKGLNEKISSGLGKLNSLRFDDESRGLQDIFSSLPYLNEKGEFKGKINSRANYIRYNFAHSSDYWRRNSNPAVDARSELFAHLSAAQCSKKQQEYMKEYFPNCWEAFNDLISNSKFVK